VAASSELLLTVDTTVLIEYSQFVLQEVYGPDIAEVGAGEDPDVRLAVGADGGVKFISAQSDHYPSVRLELWSGPAPQDAGDWDRTEEETFTATATGRVMLMTLMGEESSDEIALPGLGRYVIRVRAAGRAAARALGEAEFFEGVERWLLQIWPARAPISALR
jgi:hypothetical protein